MNKDKLSQILVARAAKCIRMSEPLLSSGDFYIAGSCIATDDINDIDVYPVPGKSFTIPATDILSKTVNSTTISNGINPPIQYCNYKKSSLRELIQSFDFTHVQAGAHIVDGVVRRVEYTDAFVWANACRTSFYTGSEYPLSSLIRLSKYNQRGELTRPALIGSTIDIVLDIVKRGFKDWEDFKDQLDAVDLGMLPEELDALGQGRLRELFERLSKG